MGTLIRKCGGCAECCKTVPVPELANRAFAGCAHMQLNATGLGCGIYEGRPRSCRAWRCMWLRQDDWGDELRPDRLGIVVDENLDLVHRDGDELPAAQVWVRPGHEEDFLHVPDVQRVIAVLHRSGLAVLWRLAPGDKARLIWAAHPEGGFTVSQIVPTPPASQMKKLPASDIERAHRAERLHAAHRTPRQR